MCSFIRVGKGKRSARKAKGPKMSFYEVKKKCPHIEGAVIGQSILFLLIQCDKKKSAVDISRNMNNLTSRTCPPHRYLCISLGVWLMYKQSSVSTWHHLKCWEAPPTFLSLMFMLEVKEF